MNNTFTKEEQEELDRLDLVWKNSLHPDVYNDKEYEYLKEDYVMINELKLFNLLLGSSNGESNCDVVCALSDFNKFNVKGSIIKKETVLPIFDLKKSTKLVLTKNYKGMHVLCPEYSSELIKVGEFTEYEIIPIEICYDHSIFEEFLNRELTTQEIEEEMFKANSGYHVLKNYPLHLIIKYRLKRLFNKLFK